MNSNADRSHRQRAEDIAQRSPAHTTLALNAMTPEAMRQVLHELQVHQIELEMQNEELRRTQLDLEAARARYFDLYDLAPVGYCSMDQQGRILEANLTVATLFGVARRELAQKRIQGFIEPGSQDNYYQSSVKLIETGNPQTCDLQMKRQDGAPIWVNLSMTMANPTEPLESNRVLRAVFKNISDHKNLENILQTSEARFRAMVEWSPEPVLVHRAGIFIYLNPAAMRLLGATAGQKVLGTSIYQWIHADFQGEVLTRMNDIAQGRALSTEAEVTLIRTDGTPIATVIQSIATAFDGAPAIQASIRDVTEHNRIDHILKVKNLELEMARNSADKANQAKSDFLSSMSHELRSPLNAILGFAQLLESGTPTPTPIQRSNLLQILRAGWFLLDLINEILDLASIESGKLSISMEPTSLKNMLDGCREMMEPQASMRDIDMCFQEVDPLIFVAADPMRVKQVLINLLANAIKYNKAQGSVNVSYGPQGAGCIRISVQDTGQGLSEDKLSQLFQPFNRLGQEAGQEEGTGIGLVVSQRLAELMGGTIGAQSTVGAGSVFWIDLRTTDARAEAIKPDLPLRSANSTPNAEESVRTLLYVEDNQANMQLVEQLIARRPDMRLLEAGNGLQALVLARAHQPNVILMDINLPGINGIQTLRLLKEDPVTAHIPVMALSANAMPDDVAAGLNAGFFRYLTKPVRITEFMDALDAGLALAHSPPPAPDSQATPIETPT